MNPVEPENNNKDIDANHYKPVDANPMLSFPRLSVWHVLAISIITLGFYYTYWLYTRTQLINKVHTSPISMNLANTVIGLLVLNFIVSFVSISNPDNMDYKMLANISSLCYSLANLYWVFTVRNRIHQMAKSGEQSLFWLNGIWTFLFQVLYLQFKINEYLDEKDSGENLIV